MNTERELNEIINRLRYQLKAIIRKLNIKYEYVDSEDFYQEALLYLWQQNESGKLKDKNDSYILQGCYYYLKNYIRKYIKPAYRKIDQAHYFNLSEQNREIDNNIPIKLQNHANDNLDEYLYYDEFNKYLSMKEKVLLNLRMKGLSTREIGKELGISHTMVSKMRKKIIMKYKFLNK